MKFLGKALAILLVTIIMLSTIPAVLGAQTEYEVESGGTANLQMEFSNIEGLQINGIQIDHPSMVLSKRYDDSQLGMNQFASNGDMFVWMNMGGVTEKAILVLQVQVAGDIGAVCKISVSYTATFNKGLSSENGTKTFAIAIKAPQTSPTEPATPKPNTPTVSVDYTHLNNQISVAQGLEQGKYTAGSWNVLQSALSEAQAATRSKNQTTVDQATENLKNAIAALVKMDYVALTSAIDAAELLQKSDVGGGLWSELSQALTEAIAQRSSADQEAVDAAAKRLLEAISQVQRYLENQGLHPSNPSQTPTESQKPTVPKEECNVSSHKTWPVLFWISLMLNVIMGVLIAAYIIAKRKNYKDTTPLVEYDIEEDDEEVIE